jgi:hypothetical protein
VIGGALAGAAAGGGFAATFMNMTTLQVGLAAAIVAVGAAGFAMQAKTNDGLRAEIAAFRAQQQAITQLRDENKALERAAADVERLRVDGTELVRLREEVAAARRQLQQARPASVEPSFSSLPPLKGPDERMTLKLPNADVATALNAIAVISGWRLVRDASLERRVIDVRIGTPVAKTQALEVVRTALRDQAGIELEPGPNGTVVVKRAAGR